MNGSHSTQPSALQSLPLATLLMMQAENRRRITEAQARNKLTSYYPDTGPLRRELYAKHLKFFENGSIHRERLFLAANRVGKTEGAGGYETTLHLTGKYPHWWKGRRFDRPVRWWMAGRTNETTRDILQHKMLGQIRHDANRKTVSGTGLVPGDDIGDVTWKQGVPDLVDTIRVKHYNKDGHQDGWSLLGVKCYQQGSGSFEGTEQDGIWLDEEPPLSVYSECLIRTMTTDGMIMITFTPLEGMSEVVLEFLPGGQLPDGTITKSEEESDWREYDE